jgi:hypothetical protein
MEPEALPRQLKEKSEKHYCVKCLSIIPADEYFANDFICDKCAEADGYPLQSTPEDKAEGRGQKDEG